MTQLQSTRHPGARWLRSTDAPPDAPAPGPRSDWPTSMHDADEFQIGVFYGDEDVGRAFPDGDRLRHVGSPHFIDLASDDRPIVRLGLGASNAMRREQARAHHPSHTPGTCANPREAQSRP